MEIRVAIAIAGDGHPVSDQGVTVPGTHDLASDLGRQRENAQRHKFGVAEAPDLLLQGDAPTKVF
jgi:hypothetical protein